MKKIFVLLVLLTLMVSCEKGSTTQKLNGSESGLPPELKGLKVYSVNVGAIDNIRVAVLDNQVKSLSYPQGKTTEYVVIVNTQDRYGNARTINGKEILFENDEILIVKK